MKNLALTILVALFFTQGVYSQTVAEIDKVRQEIKNNLPNYTKTVEHEDSSSYRYVFKKDKELKLIMIWIKDNRFDKYIDKKVEWYFVDGKMIYSEMVWTDIATGQLVDDEKVYVSNDHLIASINKDNQPVDTASAEFKTEDAELMAYAAKLEERYKQ